MKIKNQMVLALVSNGVSNITATSLDAAEAYKVIKFRRALNAAFGLLVESEKALADACGLRIGEKGNLEGGSDSIAKFDSLRKELYDDETELGELKSISYECWHELKKENNMLSRAQFEDILENILWTAPAE